jgi:TolB-like protein/class 3 adenylate cyclase
MKKNIRQLSAIMFTDMVGYTALMQSNEQKAKRNRDRHRAVLEASIKACHGQIVQYFGDGTLSVFGSAVEAINCALRIQRELQEEPKIPLRIGLHIGDIVTTSDGIYGDAVNVASRIERKSVSGGILFSDRLYDEIKNHPEFEAVSLGMFELKNVRRPVELYALTNEGLTVPQKEPDKKPSGKDISKSVAVLPFVNMSTDPENEYFSEGISEEIINALTRIEGLNVTARTSSFALKKKEIDIREAAKLLGVSFVLEGSVRKAGNRVRITAQLIKAQDGFHVFSETYDRDLKDIFAVQDEISHKIANRLRENLNAPLEATKDKKPPDVQVEAYDLYLKGRYHLYKGSFEGTKASIRYFEEAIKLAPDFALPYTGLSTVYSHFSAFRSEDPEKAYQLAKEYAEKAMVLDDTSMESVMALMHVCFVNEWDFKKSRELLAKAIQLNPGNAEIHSWASLVANVAGDTEKALVEAKIGVSLDPLSPILGFVLGEAYYTNEMYDEAMAQFDKTLEALPHYIQASILKAKTYLILGKYDKAINIFNKIELSPERQYVHWGALGYAYAGKGDLDKARDCLKRIEEQEEAKSYAFLNWSYTMLYMALNEKEKMYTYLEKSLEEKTAALLFLKVDPMFKPIKGDEQYKALVKKYF